MSQAWLRLPERSNAFWLRTITWIALRLGRPLARILLYPITAYFLLLGDRSGDASRDYLRRVLGRPPRFRDRFRHYHTFACTLLDRLFVLTGQEHRLRLEVHGLEQLMRHAREGRSCLLVGAHLGSFEILRALGQVRAGLRIKALMFGETTPAIASLYRRLNPALHEDLVFVGSAAALVGLDQAVRDGSMLAVLGDRWVPGGKKTLCRFFGDPAYFPLAPALLAQVLDLPPLLFVCLHIGWGHYRIHFEALPVPPHPRGERERAAAALMQRYADRLEHHCRSAPYNWFNFYDFWQTEAAGAAAATPPD